MRTIGLRFFNVFGERQDPAGPYAAAIPRFIAALRAHQRPVVHGDGLQSRDFTYVGNAVQAVLQALDNDDPANAGEVFNVAFGVRTTVLELLGVLREELGATDPAIASIEPQHTAGRPGDVRESLADIGKARERLGYQPSTGLREGLRRTLAWYAAALPAG
jgi:UDP-N-acetylglucosamine 4-epimerase